MSSSCMVLMPAVLRIIRAEGCRGWHSLRRFGFDLSDVTQELALALLDRLRSYDQRRSAPQTFASRVCRHRCLRILEAHRAAKRNIGSKIASFSDPADLQEDTDSTLGDTISSGRYEISIGRRSMPEAELMQLRIKVDRSIRALPAQLADVARLLAAGNSALDIARGLRISRSTVHRRIQSVRQAFQNAGLDQYVRQASRR